jgi:hypothetical protein
MNKADIRALEAQLTELPHTVKIHFISLLNLRWHPVLIAINTSHVAATVLAHKLRNGVNQLAFNVINAKIPSVARRLMHLQALLYLAFAKKINGSIIYSVCSTAYLWEKQHSEWI